MAIITLKGNLVHTLGELPSVGANAPDFELVKNDLSRVTLSDYEGHRVILNIFPSLDTGTCANSVRRFNQEAASLENTKVLCISRDLPFAQKRFCAAEGIENVETLSDFATGGFGINYGLQVVDGPMAGLNSRAVVILDENHEVTYREQVPEVSQEPNYEKALAALG